MDSRIVIIASDRLTHIAEDIILGHWIILVSMNSDRLRFLLVASCLGRFRVVSEIRALIIVHGVDHLVTERRFDRHGLVIAVLIHVRVVNKIRVVPDDRVAADARRSRSGRINPRGKSTVLLRSCHVELTDRRLVSTTVKGINNVIAGLGATQRRKIRQSFLTKLRSALYTDVVSDLKTTVCILANGRQPVPGKRPVTPTAATAASSRSIKVSWLAVVRNLGVERIVDRWE